MRRNSSGSIQKEAKSSGKLPEAKSEAKRKVDGDLGIPRPRDSPSTLQPLARTKTKTKSSKDTPEAKTKSKQGSGSKRAGLIDHDNESEEVEPPRDDQACEKKLQEQSHGPAVGMDTTFDLIFASMKESLASTISKSDLVTMRREPDEELLNARANLEEKLHRNMMQNMKDAADQRLQHILQLRDETLSRLSAEVTRCKAEEDTIREITKREYDSAVVCYKMNIRRLDMQVIHAERRIRELVHEVIGEYGKTELRLRRRQAYLTYLNSMQLMWRTNKACWDRFGAKLCYDVCRSCPDPCLQGIERLGHGEYGNSSGGSNNSHSGRSAYGTKYTLKSATLDRLEDWAEFTRVCAYVQSLLVEGAVAPRLSNSRSSVNTAQGAGDVVSILKITKPIGTKEGAARAWQKLSPPLVADTASELEIIRSHLSAWHSSEFELETAASSPRQQGQRNSNNSSGYTRGYGGVGTQDDIHYPSVGRKTNDPNFVEVPSFLQASDIAWIHPPSYLPEMWDQVSGNRHVYKLLSGKTAMTAGQEQEQEQEQEASTPSKASYRGLSESHLHLRRLLSAFNPQFASQLASTHIYMCLEEWQGAPVTNNDHSPERDTTGEVLDEDSPLKRAQASHAKPLPPPQHNMYSGDLLPHKSIHKKKDMDGLDEYYRKARSLYVSHGEAEAERYGFSTRGTVSLESHDREQRRSSEEIFVSQEAVRATTKEPDKTRLRGQLAKPLVMQCYLDTHRKVLKTIHYSSTDNTGTKHCSKLSNRRSKSQEQENTDAEPLPLPPPTRDDEDAEDLHSEWRAVAEYYPDVIRARVDSDENKTTEYLHFMPATTYNLRETSSFYASQGRTDKHGYEPPKLSTLYVLVRAQIEEWRINEEDGKVVSYPGDEKVAEDRGHDALAKQTPSVSGGVETAGQEGRDNTESEYDDASFELEEEPSPIKEVGAASTGEEDSSSPGQQAKDEARKERLQNSVGAKTIEAMRKKGAQNNRSTPSKGGAADSNSSGEKKHKAKAPPQPWTRMVMMMVPLSEACIQALIDVNRVSLIDGTTPAAMSTSSVTSNKQSKVAPQSFIHLLPDHSRRRLDLSHQQSALRELRHRYMLVRDPTYNHDASLKRDQAEVNIRRGVSSNLPKAAPPPVSQSFYLVQVTSPASGDGTGEEDNGESGKMKLLVDALAACSPSSPQYTELAHNLDDEVIRRTITARCPSFGYGLIPGSTANRDDNTTARTKKERCGEEENDDLASLSSKVSRSRSTASLSTGTSLGTTSTGGAAGSFIASKSSGSGGKKAPRKWDEAILGTVCRWRSCLCEAEVYDTSDSGATPEEKAVNGNSNTQFLCRYHASLCKFLDDRAANSTSSRSLRKGKSEKASGNKAEVESESAKYLPKNSPPLATDKVTLSEAKRDLLMIRATSSLLQELWDGKLKATLKTFTKKVIAEMGLRKRMELFANSIFGRLGPKDQKLLLGVAKGTIVLPGPGEDLDAFNRAAFADTIDTNKMDRKSAAAVAKEAKSKRLEKMQTAKEAMALLESLGPDLQVLLRNGVATGPPPPPSWAYWKDSESLTRVLTFQTTVHTALDGIMRAEVAITQELEKLADLRVFPSNELQIIKKEVKAFKAAHEDIITKSAQLEEAILAQGGGAYGGSGSPTKGVNTTRKLQGDRDSSRRALQHELMLLRNSDAYIAMVSAEYRLCEKKLSILRSKRMDEAQEFAKSERRRERKKQREEDQQKDPANFGFR